MKKLLIISILLIGQLFAVLPDSWSVNPEDFEMSMSLITLLNVNNQYVYSENLILGAFVQDECRGIESFVEGQGQMIHSLTIYTNSENETIELIIYDVEYDISVSAVDYLTFTNGSSVGTSINPNMFLYFTSDEFNDFDEDGEYDMFDDDDDNDGYVDEIDGCPNSELINEIDYDSDGCFDFEDMCQGGDDRFDIDSDGVPNDCDVDIILHEGANLISFYALPEDNSLSIIFNTIGQNISGIIGSGVASSNFGNGSWIGNLEEIDRKSGYWLIMDESVDFQTIGIPNNNVIYSLEEGNNLCSYSYSLSQPVEDALPINIQSSIFGIATEGLATMNVNGSWEGSLTHFDGGKGYWIQLNNEIEFSYNVPVVDGLMLMANNYEDNVQPIVPLEFDFIQTGKQAFFFVSQAIINGESLEDGDWLVAYHNDVVVGSRAWNGEFTDLPAMGYESNNFNTAGYSESGSLIEFKVFDNSEGQLVNMELIEGENTWQNNALKQISIEGFIR